MQPMSKWYAGAPRPGVGYPLWPLQRLWAVHRQLGLLWFPHVLLCVGPTHLCGHGGCWGSHGGPLHQSQCQDHTVQAPVHSCQVPSFGGITELCCCLSRICLGMSALNTCVCLAMSAFGTCMWLGVLALNTRMCSVHLYQQQLVV